MDRSGFFRNAFALGAALVLLLAGCGSEHASSPAPQQPPAGNGGASSLAFVDLNDTTITSIQLSTSSEYDPSTNEVRIFALPRDQDGNPLMDFNSYNFVLTLNSGSAPYTVDPEDLSLSVEASADRIIALVIDSSGSMSSIDSETGETRLEVAKQAAKLFVDLMGPGDRAAVVTFSTSARTVQPLTGDTGLLTAAIDSLTPDGATNFGGGIQEGVSAVGTRPGRRAMILLTDGDDTVDTVVGGPSLWLGNASSTRNQGVEAALENDITVFTVGLGTDLSATGFADLQTIAGETGGAFFQAPQATDLLTAFGETIPSAVDSLTPIETYVLTAPSPGRPITGISQELSFRLSAFYMNGNSAPSAFVADSTGSYRVP
ncbi:MAG: VWA domain-containing protein [Deltaproteobacteria bacterium]|nr:VWA domain-containing protein [Deltaproteobacteria bacterium]